jgi:hypothetical protein
MPNISRPRPPSNSRQPAESLFDPIPIPFPSDAITLAQMRRRDPQLFTRETLMKSGCLDAFATYCFEYTLAANAFAKALGQPDPYPRSDRAGFISALNDAYKEYGLSTGMQQTRLLIRNLETAAIKQAQKSRGASRG